MSSAHRAWTIGGGLLAVAIAAATACSADVHDAAPASVAASSTAAAAASSTSAGRSSSPPSSAAPATVPATATTSAPPPMPAAQASAIRAQLAALAKRLPHLALTAPATWAQYAGTTPDYVEDITSCPHVAATLGTELGQKWTYAYGKLPTGPAGCTWTPVPWVPDRPPADRLFVTIGYQSGPVADLLHQPGYCDGGHAAPTLAVPTVGSDAVLDGCEDSNGTVLGVSVADPPRTGVWTLGVYAGSHVPASRAVDALVAVVRAARQAYPAG